MGFALEERPAPARGRGDPLALAGRGGDAAVQAHRPLEGHRRAAEGVARQEVEVERRRLRRQRADLDLDAGGFQPREAGARRPRVRVAVAGDDPRDTGPDQGVGARRGVAGVGAGLQRHVDGRAAGPLPRPLEGDRLGVGAAETPVVALAHHLPVAHHDGADHRVRGDAVAAPGGQAQGLAQEVSRGGQRRTPGGGIRSGRPGSRRRRGRAPASGARGRPPRPCRPWRCRRAWPEGRRRPARPG